MTETVKLWCERGGTGEPALVLLHGVGANGSVWDGLTPFIEAHWPGRWIIPDLRGHGRSRHGAPYGIGVHAADVAGLLEPNEEVTVVGHSMGGAVAIALATGMFGVSVRRAVAFSIKVEWTDDDLARGAKVAATTRRLFETREAAVERGLLVSGLKGLVAPDSAAAQAGVEEYKGQFRLATDPLVNDTGRPDFPSIARSARDPISLLTGEFDTIGHVDGMRRLGQEVTVLTCLGHNPHVEAPEVLWRAIENDLR